jgi:RNA polymerase sigma-70 factor, ECF subfamily
MNKDQATTQGGSMATTGLMEMDSMLGEGGSRAGVLREQPAQQEAHLMTETLGGSGEAFAALIRPYLDRFTRCIHRILLDDEATQAALQEALLSMHADLGSCNTGANFFPWAYAICIDEALFLRRSRNRRKACDASSAKSPNEPSMSTRMPYPESPLTSTLSPIGHVPMNIKETLAHLPDEQRVVFILTSIEGMDTDQVARKLGISRGSIRHHLHNALLQFRGVGNGIRDGITWNLAPYDRNEAL